MPARRHRDAHFQARIRGERVFLPLGIAQHVPGKTLWGRSPVALAADRERPGSLAVETNLETLRLIETGDVVVNLTAQADLDQVLAVDGKVMMNGDPASRTERQLVADLSVLLCQIGNSVGLGDRPRRARPERQAADLSGRRHVAFQERRRNRQQAGHVVEAMYVGVVGRQQRRGVDVERQQVADGVLVLGSIQAVQAVGSTWIRVQLGRTVELRFEQRHEGIDRDLVRTRQARRRHRARVKLLQDSFQDFRVPPRVRQVHRIEREIGRPQLLIVTTNAVGAQDHGRIERSGSGRR